MIRRPKALSASKGVILVTLAALLAACGGSSSSGGGGGTSCLQGIADTYSGTYSVATDPSSKNPCTAGSKAGSGPLVQEGCDVTLTIGSATLTGTVSGQTLTVTGISPQCIPFQGYYFLPVGALPNVTITPRSGAATTAISSLEFTADVYGSNTCTGSVLAVCDVTVSGISAQ